jgi:hypothetical protein
MNFTLAACIAACRLPMSSHESFDRTHAVAPASDRSFGLVFAAVFAAVAGYRYWGGHGDAPAWLGGSVLMALLGLFWAAPLAPLNRLWMRLGAVLHAVVTPLLMGLIFFVVRKKFWLLPLIFMMLVLGGLLVLAQGSAVAPFIYTLF